MHAMLDVEEATADQAVGPRGTLTWLGHATVLLTTVAGTRIIFDPWIEGNPKSPISSDALGTIDAIAVTHGHFDHMGSVIPLAAATGARVVCVPEMAAYFGSMGVENVTEMNKGGTIAVGEARLTMVTADHSCGLAVGENVPNAYGGNPVGFVVRLPEGQGRPIYVSGDTNIFGDMALIHDLYDPTIALIPIDGHYNMGPREAAHAVKLLGVERVVPIHYGTFPILTGTPSELATFVRHNGANASVVVLDPGDYVTVAD